MAKEHADNENTGGTLNTGYNKRFEDLTFSDDYIFKLVMEQAEIFEAFLKVIMPQLEVEKLVSLETEKPFTVNYFFHGARFDVLAKVKDKKGDSGKKFINMEMQVCDEGETPERSLYYLALLIIMSLKKGESYKTIADCCVIFFCKFDPLKKGLPVYTFDMKCEEKANDESIPLGKDIRIILFNAPAYEKCEDSELKALLSL